MTPNKLSEKKIYAMFAGGCNAMVAQIISNMIDSIRQSFESSWFSINKEFSLDWNFTKIVRFEKLTPNRGAHTGAIAPILLSNYRIRIVFCLFLPYLTTLFSS